MVTYLSDRLVLLFLALLGTDELLVQIAVDSYKWVAFTVEFLDGLDYSLLGGFID